MKKFLLGLLICVPFFTFAQQGANQAFQPIGNDYAITVGATCTPAQVPSIGALSQYPQISLMLTNLTTTVAYVAVGPTQASVTSPTIANAGSGTLGASGNTTPVLNNGVIFTVTDASWICAVTPTGSTTLHVQAGRGQ